MGFSRKTLSRALLVKMTKFHSIIDKISQPHNLESVFHRVSRRKGAPGPDGITIEDYGTDSEVRLKSLSVRLLSNTYRFSLPSKRIITTYRGGSLEICIWNIEDRIVHCAIARTLWRQLGNLLEPWTFGYCRSRNLQAARITLDRLFHSFPATHFFSVDIASWYSSTPIASALQRLCECVADGKVLDLTGQAILSAETVGGLPAGTPLSDLLANLALRKVDSSLDRERMIRYCDNIVGFGSSYGCAEEDVRRVVWNLGESGMKPASQRIKIVSTANVSDIAFDDGAPGLPYEHDNNDKF